MDNGKKMYVTAEEAAEMLGASSGYAYNIILGLNEYMTDMEKKVMVRLCAKILTRNRDV